LYGFTGKVTKHKAGMYLRFPSPTVKSSNLEGEELLHIEIRNMNGEVVEVARKTQAAGGDVKVYLPKNVKQELSLEHKNLVDVFFQKD